VGSSRGGVTSLKRGHSWSEHPNVGATGGRSRGAC
jgi:hypothetical protein